MLMKRMPPRLFGIPAALALSAALGIGTRAQTPFSATNSPVKDITVTTKVAWKDMSVLKEISTEFAQGYRFASSTTYYKEPGKFRVDSKAGAVNVRYIINGNTKTLKAGAINKRWDISKKPGQLQGAPTVGLVTPDWTRLLTTRYLGEATINGVKTVSYEARLSAEPKGSYSVLYMDPERNYIVRNERHFGDGKIKNVFDHLEPKRVSGVWVPTKTKVYDGRGRLGAITEVTDLKVNTGLAESLFKT